MLMLFRKPSCTPSTDFCNALSEKYIFRAMRFTLESFASLFVTIMVTSKDKSFLPLVK